jgi:uncharacterized protein DUF3891
VLLRPEPDGAVLAIAQTSHAWISGQLARAWGDEGFPAPAPWEEVCLGAEQHDVGMAEWDLRPTLNPDTGLPHAFIEMPLDVHMRLWSEAPFRMLAQSRYAALLVSLHGSALYERRDLEAMPPAEAQQVREFLDGQRQVQKKLLASLGADADEVARNRRLVWTWDGLSLAVCLRWAPFSAEGVPGADGPVDISLRPAGEDDRSFTLDPWPFGRGRVELRCDARRLEGRWEDEDEMRAALRDAPWESVRFELVRADASRDLESG